MRTGTVVVGVDGTRANRGALRFAVEESRRWGEGLRLVHVVPDHAPISPMTPVLVPGDLTAAGESILAQATGEVRILGPDIEFDAWLRHGVCSTELIRAAEGARVLVLGRDDRAILHRIVVGDTATRAAARAPVPVVEVPAQWHEDGTSEEHGVVLVGVKSPAHATELLAHAFAVAQARAATLVALHAWHLPNAYDDIIEARVAREQVEREATAELDSLLHPWRSVYPDVDVEVRVVHDRPGHVLVESSTAADLLVLVRRAHGLPEATHLGGTARAVLRKAQCPVMVVPPTAALELPTLVLESQGQLLK
ncbi:universal stress protein [Nocardioides pyridinolyticus]